MRYNKNIKRYIAVAGMIVILWIILALLISSITFITTHQENYPLSVAEIIAFEIQCIAPWILSTPIIIWATRKYRFEKALLYTSIPVHFFTALFVFVFHSVVQSYEVSVYFDHTFNLDYFKRDFIRFLDMRLMLYVGVMLGVYAVDFQRKIRESRLRKLRLKAQLNRAHYQALLNQIQPTFLLNSIDAIKEKSQVDSNEAEQLLTVFSDLLRIMLQNAYKEEVTIREDLKSYHMYLKILEKRLETSIKTKTEIQEACYEALVPSFLMLVPIFEEVIFFEEKSSLDIEGITYRATCDNNKVQIAIILGGIKVSSAKLTTHLYDARFPDVIRRLEDRYDEAVELKTKIRRDRIQIDLRIPFKIHSPLYQKVKEGDSVEVFISKNNYN